ncbi:peptide ABC transporter substrate-binding protein [Enterococcus rotai]|uniref:peptide ABC transporter substrate-binding protein n=1 Tax=Enterococcus rotai TaxID=118060 RepID=UPI0035C750D8
MRNTTLGYLLAAASLTILLSGCGSSGAKTGDSGQQSANSEQTFSVVAKQEIPSIDASVTNDVVGWGVLKNTSEGLFRADKDGKLIPAGAAESPKISEDGLTYTIKLREDAVWSNGDPVVAADYVYGWQRTVAPKTASEVAYLFESIKNYQAIMDGQAPAEDLGIKALNDYELEVTLEVPVPYMESLLSLPPFFPQNEKTINKSGEKYASSSEHMVYNGPFVLSDFEGAGTDTKWSYVKNEKYWDQANVKMEKINFDVVKEDATALNLFQDGQTDDIVVTGELAQQMVDDPAFFSQDMSNATYVEYNQTKKEFQNENIRKAISYALDRQTLVDQVLGDGSIAATGLVPKNMSFNPETEADFVKDSGNHLKYDPEKAKESWEKAKKELGIDTLKINLLSSDADSAKKVVEYMQGAIQGTLKGVTVEVSSVPLSVRLERGNQGDFDMILVGWGAEYNDPSVFLELFASDNINNSGKYNNKEFDKYLKASATTDAGNPKARWTDLLEAEKVLMDTMGVCPVYQKAEAHLRNPKVKGILPSGPEYDYKWTFIE